MVVGQIARENACWGNQQHSKVASLSASSSFFCGPPQMLSQKFIAGALIALSLLSRAEAITAKVEVLATATDVREYFVARAVISSSRLEARLSAADKCVTFGRFRGYSLHLLPFPATAENLPSAHWKHGTGHVVDKTQDRSAQF